MKEKREIELKWYANCLVGLRYGGDELSSPLLYSAPMWYFG